MIPPSTASAQDSESSLFMRVWRWFVYDAVEAEAICLCPCHLGAANHCVACPCQICPVCWRCIKRGMMAQHSQQCE